jgi:hypothetical protein
VYVAVHPERGFVDGGAGFLVGDRRQPDVPALVTLADRFERDELRIFGRVGLQDFREFGVAIESVKTGGRHRSREIRAKRAVWRDRP